MIEQRLHRVPSEPLRECGHLMPFPTHRRCGFHSFSFSPSHSSRSTTTASADFSLRLFPVTLSGVRRDLPSLHDRRIYATAPWSQELRDHLPARPGRQRLLSGSCSSTRSFDPRFLPTIGRPHAVALHFTHCDQLVTGLTPVRVRPCWAHKQKGTGWNPCPSAIESVSVKRRKINPCSSCCAASP